MSNVRRSLLASIVGLAVLAGAAQGLVETSAITAYEIRLPGGDYDLYQRQSSATREASRSTEAALVGVHGGAWRVPAWNPLTDTPHYVLGSGFETGVRLDDDVTAESVARAEIEAHPSVFRSIPMADLDLSDVRRGVGKVAVHFQQTHGGVPIIGGRAHLTFTEAGRLFVMKSDLYRDINLSTSPSVSRQAATDIAIADLPVDRGTDAVDGDVVLRILPVPTGAGVRHHLVWVARVETQDPIGIWVSHVDAHTGEIIYRYNDVHFLDYSGTAVGDVQPDTYCNGEEVQGLKYMNVSVSGLPVAATDGDGNWNAGEGGTGDRDVTAFLAGTYVNVNNTAGGDAEFNGVVTGGVPFEISFNDLNAQQDERDVFNAVGDIHDFFEQFDPGYGYSNGLIIANVSINDDCNAFWNGQINFYRELGGCANTGEIQGVVHHEFGHGVQNDLIGFQGNQGLGEGNSDVLANLITQESVIGRGFNLGVCNAGIRNSDNTLQYPEDLTGAVHADGRIIAGFHWDAMEGLQAEYGEEAGTIQAATIWHFGRMLEQPTNQPDQVMATYIADDDNGDLSDGTPNCVIIDVAANNHGYEDLCGLVVQHDTIDTRTTEGDAQAEASITSIVSEITGVSLFYMVDNAAGRGIGFTEVPMTDDDTDSVYEATIPGLVELDQVAYYLEASNALGVVETDPEEAPAVVHRFDIATLFEDQESDQGWTVDAEGLDDEDTGTWERVNPIGTAAQPEDDHTTAGTLCWVTEQLPPGGDLGSTDVDGGSTRLYSPTYDLSGSTTAIAKYWYWYSNNTGATPGTDFWVVDVRNDGGPWTTIQNTNVSTFGWEQAQVDLVALFGTVGTVQLRFTASDLAQGSLVEAGVDDFAILADDAEIVAVGGGASGAPRASYLADASPNPFNPRTTFRFGLNEAGDVRIEIFDVSGRLVRALVDEPLTAGHYQVSWDGTDRTGKPLGSGAYYARMTSSGGVVQQQKMTLLK